MKTILKQLQILADSDLYALSEAVDVELTRRDDLTTEVPDSARRRAIERGESYRRRTGATAPPVRHVGLRPSRAGQPRPARAAAHVLYKLNGGTHPLKTTTDLPPIPREPFS